MGYQPSLDGLRGVSVVAVLLYHAGFSWMPGGFFGVEVFFVISGFLITSLLIDEHERKSEISFRQFWTRRMRRLFPAMYAVLLAVAVWAAFAGSAAQQSQLRREIPWSIFYVNNWGQILGGVPYFSGDQSLLRHLWSLAVEEQWYLIWPLVFVGLMRLKIARHLVGGIVIAAAFAAFAYMFWMQHRAPTLLGGPPAAFDGVDRTNYLYLSTITRAGGILLGAGAAFIWRPWQWERVGRASGPGHVRASRSLDSVGAAALTALGCAAVVAQLTAGYVYLWLLPLVSILSLVTVMVAVHPAAVAFRRIMSWFLLVEVGKRSYGWYLWSWPIFVIGGATDGAVRPFVLAMLITVVIAEVSYRWLEIPVREGLLGRWWRDRAPITYSPVVGGVLVVATLALFYENVGQFNRFRGGGDAVFELALDIAPSTVTDSSSAPESSAASESSRASSPQTATTAPDFTATSIAGSTPSSISSSTAISVVASAPIPASTSVPVAVAESAWLAIVGDSQANALAINLPDGIGDVFQNVVNGSVDGCSVYDSGGVHSSVSFINSFAICDGWQEEWANAAADSDVALVVIGAWDVFDIDDGDTIYGFGTPASDELFVSNLESGIDAMLAEGAKVGLLEVACMRPQDVKGAGVRALPERGDDARVAHLNVLLRTAADEYGPEVQLVEGPDEWCDDEAIASDLGYRWDGVHVYKPGANLIYTTIARDLLALAV